MYAFDATYEVEGAARAERAFYVRSVRELRRWQTFGPPLFFAIVVALSASFNLPPWFVVASSVVLVLSIAGPVFFFIARPIAAGRLARKYPIRHVSLTHEAVEVAAGGQRAVINWPRVKHVWVTGGYILLVLGKFGSISIPRRSLPPGAHEFILASVKGAA